MFVIPAFAYEMTEDQKKVLEPALDKLLQCLENGEKEVAELQKAYTAAVENTKTVAAQPKKWYQKSALDPVKKAQKAETKALTALKEAETKVAVVKCDLQVMGKRSMTEEELKQSKGELSGYMVLAQQAINKVFPKLEKKNAEALVRLERIPSEKAAVEKTIAEHEKKIAELEASKAGKGWMEKTSINTKIATEKAILLTERGKPAKLDKEKELCEKKVAEYQEALLKKTSLDVALAYLASGDANFVPPTVAPVEPEEGEEGETAAPKDEDEE